MDEYTMKYTYMYQISENVWLDWEFKPGTPALIEGALPLSYMYPGQLVSMVLGQTTTFLFLQSFYPLRDSQQTHVHPVRT